MPNRSVYACLHVTESIHCQNRRVNVQRWGNWGIGKLNGLIECKAHVYMASGETSVERHGFLGEGTPLPVWFSGGVRTIKKPIHLVCPCSCQSWSPPVPSCSERGQCHPGATSMGQWPGRLDLSAKFPLFHLRSFSEALWRLSPLPPLGSGTSPSEPAGRYPWEQNSKFAIPISALVGWLGSPTQNSWERRDVRAAVGKITVLLMTCCAYLELSVLQTLTEVTLLFPAITKQTQRVVVTGPGREKGLPNRGGHGTGCLPCQGFQEILLPVLGPTLDWEYGNLGIFRKPLGVLIQTPLCRCELLGSFRMGLGG